MLNTEATHNFVLEDETKHVGLKANMEGGVMKAVNSLVELITSIAQGVHMMLKMWSGKIYPIVPVDKFKMVLSSEYFD